MDRNCFTCRRKTCEVDMSEACRADTRRPHWLGEGGYEPGRPAVVPPAPASTPVPVYNQSDAIARLGERFVALFPRLLAFEGDEARVALRVFEDTVGRLEVGRERHGDLRLDGGHDWTAEAREEALDGGVYLAAAAELAAARAEKGGA